MDTTTQPAAETKPAALDTTTSVVALSTADVTAAIAAERTRASTIRMLGKKHGLADDFIDDLVGSDTPLATAREKILDKLAEGGDAQNIGHTAPARVTKDQRDKFVEGASNWLLVKSGVAHLVERAAALGGETVKVDPGEFRGVRNSDLAREALSLSGIQANARDPEILVREAMTARSAITQSTSDFPILFENAVHRILQAAYATTPDTWTRF